MVKRVATALIFVLMLVVGANHVNIAPEKGTSVEQTAVKDSAVPVQEIRQDVTLLSYLMYPYPGYPLRYNNTVYDSNVKKVQARLNTMGDMFYCGEADGYFGPLTLEAVKNFQWNEGLVIDGVVGPITWTALFTIY